MDKCARKCPQALGKDEMPSRVTLIVLLGARIERSKAHSCGITPVLGLDGH